MGSACLVTYTLLIYAGVVRSGSATWPTPEQISANTEPLTLGEKYRIALESFE